MVALVALAIVSFANFCNDADEATTNYRLAGLLAGTGAAIAPSAWAVLAHRSRRVWLPWAAIALVFVGWGVFLALASTDDPHPFCS